MTDLKRKEIWFVTGSQHLYGPETLKQVDADSAKIAASLNAVLPLTTIFKPVLKTADEITALCRQADAAPDCAGVIVWMHTFSPAKMWINGLRILKKPVCHLHTQFNRDIPWKTIDMDFMNLNQSAHGDREYGFIMTRLRRDRTVVTGHWQDPKVTGRIAVWSRAAAAWHDWQGARFCRFGDNMREVAVTEGDKVEAQIRFGFSVNGYGIGDLVKAVNDVTENEAERLAAEYDDTYEIAPSGRKGGADRGKILVQARIELGMSRFLEVGGFKGFTTTFEDLHGLSQLPGLAVQRLMDQGYGFGAEGDWKHCALVRAMKVMGAGLKGGCSFMEDYTYHLDPSGPAVLGAHMLEVCPSIASGKPKLEVHPLGIGGKEDPARLVFNVNAGPALNASLIDMGNRFRMIVNAVDCVIPKEDLPKLPVARALWVPRPDLSSAATAWIYCGGAHHTAFSQPLTPEYMEDFCEMAGIERILIDSGSSVSSIKDQLRWNEAYWVLADGLKR
jgi:L-arabinose isomerase